MKIYVCFVLSLMCLLIQGQQISPEVIVSSGECFNTSSGESLSFSVGEAITETVINSSVTLTQGFQQGNYEITELAVEKAIHVELEVFPVPTTDFITIEFIEYMDDCRADIYNNSGIRVLSGELLSGSTNLNLSELTAGVYILVITDESSNTLRSFQIIKN